MLRAVPIKRCVGDRISLDYLTINDPFPNPFACHFPATICEEIEPTRLLDAHMQKFLVQRLNLARDLANMASRPVSKSRVPIYNNEVFRNRARALMCGVQC